MIILVSDCVSGCKSGGHGPERSEFRIAMACRRGHSRVYIELLLPIEIDTQRLWHEVEYV